MSITVGTSGAAAAFLLFFFVGTTPTAASMKFRLGRFLFRFLLFLLKHTAHDLLSSVLTPTASSALLLSPISPASACGPHRRTKSLGCGVGEMARPALGSRYDGMSGF